MEGCIEGKKRGAFRYSALSGLQATASATELWNSSPALLNQTLHWMIFG